MRHRFITPGVFLALAIPALASFSGSFYPTEYNGTSWAVQQNIFTDPAAVYLSGGPHNTNANGLPIGTYYFQLTDPSGKTLLSTDDISCRQVVVLPNAGGNGVIYGVPAGSPPGTCTTGYHPDALAAGFLIDTNGADPVLMYPFTNTPNNGGVYKAWLTPVGSWDSTCTIRSGAPGGVTDTSNSCSGSFGFSHSSSKTNNFKIDCSSSTSSSIAAAAVSFGGTGYAVGDTGTIAGGTEGSYVVTGVSGGAVTSFTITNAGIDYTVATDATTPGGAQRGGGSGFMISITSTTSFCSGVTTTPPQSLISGTKYFDVNSANTSLTPPNTLAGILEPNDLPLPLWTINIYNSNTSALVDTEVTDAGGSWAFFATDGTPYTACEVLQPGWTQSGPSSLYTTPPYAGYTPPGAVALSSTVSAAPPAVNCWQLTTAGTAVTGLDFGNYLQITGKKQYNTTSADSGTGIPNWPVTITCDSTSVGTNLGGPFNYCQNSTVYTDKNGNYQYLPTGPFASYVVCEGTETGWTQSYPTGSTSPVNNATVDTTHCGTTVGWDGTIGMAAGTGLDFSNYMSISGTKHYNTSAADSGPGVGGVTINIAYTPAVGSPTVAQVTTAVTTGAYSYTFPGPITGSYTVSETVPTGWTQSYPASPGTYTGTPGTTAGTGLDFANYVAVSGTKFYGTTTTTLNGWTINLNNATPAVVATTTTAGSGTYSLAIPTYPFTGTICEVMQPGWTQQSPASNGCYTIGLTAGSLAVPSGPFNFQNVIILSGLKFYDLNLDKIQDGTEAGISGFKIAIYSCLGSGCTVGTTPTYVYTGSGGAFTWTPLGPITNFKVCEVLPPTGNWTETTTPACYTGTVGQAVQTALTFGNVCEGAGVSPYTQGFWYTGNPNGTALLLSSANYPYWATGINSLDQNTTAGKLTLVPNNGTAYMSTLKASNSPTNYAQADDTTLAGGLFTVSSGANAADMLSAQFATMELNTLVPHSSPYVNSSALMQVGTAATLTANGCTAALGIPQLMVNSAGYAQISSVFSYASGLLQLNPNTKASSAMRNCQNFIQTAFNNANNNQALTIIQPVACTVPTY